jgi:DNA sulfur modification protein DndD
MRIKRVQFKNYRCFLDEEVVLPSNYNNKNIDLFIAPNGGGKTEFLFSIWWALYPDSFNFSDLKGKEATNYSLNSDLYFQLTNGGSVGAKKECFVEVEFESDNITYVVKRKETFEKRYLKKPLTSLSCTFYKIDENGITSSPITDPKDVNSHLERIIPQKVLSGIIFDGERMKRISSIDNESVKSIEGVISDITNKEVLISLESELLSLKNFYQKAINRHAHKLSSSDLEVVGRNIVEKEKELKDHKLRIANINSKIPAFEQTLISISEKLRELEPSKNIELELVAANTDLKHYEDNYEKDLTSFKTQMSKEGAYILINKLAKDLDTVINNTDVPVGLNVKIVENILEKDNCICGNSFTYEMRQSLIELNKKLPPNDINATIKEKTKTVQANARRSKDNLKKLYNSMDENYENIEETKSKVSILKTKLTESVSDQVVKLEVERARNEDHLQTLKDDKNKYNSSIENINSDLEKLKDLQKKLTEQRKELRELQSRKDFVEKSLKAVKEIQEKYRMIALTEINVLFREAYKEISEDYINGRRAYLTHILNNKYLMLTYNESDLINYLYGTKGYEKEEIMSNNVNSEDFERAISAIKISNSTGQQTVLSLAFVKAMLDYSRRETSNRDKELKKVKSYPVVIDAPFSDLSGENLENASSSLNNFSEQVLLLINHDSYKSIQSNIENNINTVHYFYKTKEKQCSRIEKGGTMVD